jgi:hypothetical protein
MSSLLGELSDSRSATHDTLLLGSDHCLGLMIAKTIGGAGHLGQLGDNESSLILGAPFGNINQTPVAASSAKQEQLTLRPSRTSHPPIRLLI